MKIVFFGLEKAEQSLFLNSFDNAEVSFFDEKLDENNVDKAKDAEIISVFVNSEVNKTVIDAMPNLKFIATRATGYDNIDCEYAKSKGIVVSNVPAYGSHTVAEFAFTLILSLSRNIINANNYIRQSQDFHYSDPMQGFNLEGRTLGVIGTGKIGKNVVKIAKGFDMNVIAYDLYPDEAFAKDIDFNYKSLPELLTESDIITLHAPGTKENHHLINKESISQMKKGVYIVNTARGELIDTIALLEGLKEGIIAGAGLDVLEDEKNLKENKNEGMNNANHELMKMPNVIITPHIAFYTREAVAEILKITAENIKNFISASPKNLVN